MELAITLTSVSVLLTALAGLFQAVAFNALRLRIERIEKRRAANARPLR